MISSLRVFLRPYLVGNIRALLPAYQQSFENVNSILDVGSGNGLHAMVLTEAYPTIDITTLDMGDYRWDQSRKMRHISYDGHTMPISSRLYDVSLLFFVLHHAVDQDKLLSETARVTRKKILICEEVYTNWLQKLYMVFYDILVNTIIFGEQISDPVFHTESEWVSIFKHANLTIEKMHHLKRTSLFTPQRVLYVLTSK